MGILQGTTPKMTIAIPADKVLLSDVAGVELTLSQMNHVPAVHGTEDVVIDLENNAIVYQFTEEETLALSANVNMWWQLRLKLRDGNIVGTLKQPVPVDDLINDEVMA